MNGATLRSTVYVCFTSEPKFFFFFFDGKTLLSFQFISIQISR